MRRVWRYGAIKITMVGLGCALLQGCSPAIVGVTGISVASDGTPVGVIQICRHSLDEAVLYRQDKPDADSGVGDWAHDDPVTQFTSWPLNIGGNRWSPPEHPFIIEKNVHYRLYGASHDNSGSSVGVDFTPEDLAAMRPGQVRYFGYDPKIKDDAYITVTVDSFRANACKNN
jgi:hypothetical protein